MEAIKQTFARCKAQNRVSCPSIGGIRGVANWEKKMGISLTTEFFEKL
jgi:hypothetical protein